MAGRRGEGVDIAVHGGDQQVGAPVSVKIVSQHHAVACLPDVHTVRTACEHMSAQVGGTKGWLIRFRLSSSASVQLVTCRQWLSSQLRVSEGLAYIRAIV